MIAQPQMLQSAKNLLKTCVYIKKKEKEKEGGGGREGGRKPALTCGPKKISFL